MGKKSVRQMRHGDEFLKACECAGFEVRSGSGSHMIVQPPAGPILVIPVGHSQELGKGLRLKIIKRLLQLGLLLIPILVGYMIVG